MTGDGNVKAVMRGAWEAVRGRFAPYDVCLPGAPEFVCLAGECPVHCCFRFSVSLGDAEVWRMEQREGLAPAEFLECEKGEPIALPLAEPYLLAREDGRCRLLRADLLCGAYEGRPNGCRLFPHQVVVVDAEHHRSLSVGREEALELVERALAGERVDRVPLLIRHRECPGFTGPPMGEGRWADLVREIATLQWGEIEREDWPGIRGGERRYPDA